MPPHDNCNWERDKKDVVERLQRIERMTAEIQADIPKWIVAVGVSMFLLGAMFLLLFHLHESRIQSAQRASTRDKASGQHAASASPDPIADLRDRETILDW